MPVAINYDTGTLAYYKKYAREYRDSTAKLHLSELYKPFLKEIPVGGHILDAGCGSGRDTKAFLERGYRVTGIDASPEMAQSAVLLTGQHCEVLSFRKMEFNGLFDGIWACASLLHVSKHEMADVMRRFIRALKIGGIFYISLKEGEGERFAEDGRFFNYYTEGSFRDFLTNFPSLREIAVWKTDEVRSQPNAVPWLNFLLKKCISNGLV